jgi:hypothetical protein
MTAVVVIVAGVVLLAVVVGGLVAIAAVLVGGRDRAESGLGDEDVASILGYPMYPVWQARKNGEADRPDEPVGR